MGAMRTGSNCGKHQRMLTAVEKLDLMRRIFRLKLSPYVKLRVLAGLLESPTVHPC